MVKNFDEVMEQVRSIEPFTVSVAAAEDRELLLAVKTAADLGFVRPVLTGDTKAIGDLCAEIGLKPLDILPAAGEEEAVAVVTAQDDTKSSQANTWFGEELALTK